MKIHTLTLLFSLLFGAITVFTPFSASAQTINNVTAYGAVPNDSTNDTAAITAAQNALPAGGGVVYFPAGTYIIDGAGIIMGKANVVYRGAGMYLTTLKRASPATNNVMFQGNSSLSTPPAGIAIEDMMFDGNNPPPTTARVSVALSFVDSPRVSRCRFYNMGTYAVAIGSSSSFTNGATIEDSIFYNPSLVSAGQAYGGGVLIQGSSQNATIQGNTFRYLDDSILFTGTPSMVSITNNSFDLGWRYIKEKYANEGATVSYTSTSLVDSSAPFVASSLKEGTTNPYHNVRAMPLKGSGTANFSGTTLTDAGAGFVAAGVRAGDIVRVGSGGTASFGIVASVGSATSLTVEQWLLDANRTINNTPTSGTSYNVYGVLMGSVWAASGSAYTTTTIQTQYGWRDLDGHLSTPPAGTRYEVMIERPNYNIHANPGAHDITITGNTVRRGWSDQISLFSTVGSTPALNATISNNLIEDGEDMGITVNGDNNTISGNTIRRPGTSAVWVDGYTNLVDGNYVYGSKTMSPFEGGGITIYSNPTYPTNGTTVSNNIIQRDNTANRVGIMVISTNGGTINNTALKNNTISGHADGDITLYAKGTGTISNTDLRNGGSTNSNTGSFTQTGVLANITGTMPTMLPYSTVVSGSASPATSVYGQPITLQSSVALASPGGLALVPGTPGSTNTTGRVNFREGATSRGWTPVVDGNGNLLLTGGAAIPAGSRTLTAYYEGNVNFNASTSPSFSVTINKADSTLTVAQSASTSTSGQTVTFTATLGAVSPSVNPPAAAPGGTVQFKLDGVNFGPLQPLALSGGQYVATYSSSALTTGAHTITAVYNTGTNFNGSSGNTVNHTRS